MCTLLISSSFYCIVLLTTLLISSCYWQPFPIDSTLSTPWSDDITTFAEALNATLTANYTKPLPSRMRVLDRCWCDLSSGKFFEPFNISGWEYASVQRMKKDLERAEGITTPLPVQTPNATLTTDEPVPAESPPSPKRTTKLADWVRSPWQYWLSRRNSTSGLTANSTNGLITSDNTTTTHSETELSESQPSPADSVPTENAIFRWLRPEYDLQPYGLGMVIDLRWS